MKLAPVEKAIALALKHHRGQRDKVGQPYVMHLVRVAGRFMTEEAQCVAILHDMLEDTKYPEAVLYADFGDKIGDAVVALSRFEDETYMQYIRRCKQNKLAKQVKLADLRDNMRRDRGPHTPEMEHHRKMYWRALQELDAR